MNIGANISDYLKERGISKTFLAKKMGITRQAVHSMCNGNVNIKTGTLLKVARILDVDVSTFFEENNKEEMKKK